MNDQTRAYSVHSIASNCATAVIVIMVAVWLWLANCIVKYRKNLLDMELLWENGELHGSDLHGSEMILNPQAPQYRLVLRLPISEKLREKFKADIQIIYRPRSRMQVEYRNVNHRGSRPKAVCNINLHWQSR